jgi:hypothetical protein
MDNRVDIGILKEKQDNPATQQWMKETTERHGDAVAFEYTDAYIAHTAKKTENDLYILIPCYCLIFLLVAGVLVMGRAQSRVTTTGHTVNTVSMTDREVRRRVEASQPEFPASLDDKIRSMVKEKK